MPQNPESIFVAMLALLVFASPTQADLINHTYWAYIPNLPLLQVVEWTDIGLVVSSNDSVHMPPPWSLEGPSNPEEEGRLINISLGYESEKAMAPHSSTFAWKIPWMEEPGRLQSMGSQRVRHD